jgi:hypothetical protein
MKTTDELMRDYDEAKAKDFPSLRNLTPEQVRAASDRYERMMAQAKGK